MSDSWACDPTVTSTIVNSYQTAGPLFVGLLQSLLAAQCALVGDDVWPRDATDAVLEGDNMAIYVVCRRIY